MNVEVFTPTRGTFIETVLGGLGSGGGFIIPPDVARKSQPNVFLRESTFNGIRLVPKTIISDYNVLATDTILWVNASAGPVIIHLSAALGSGQLLITEKVDLTDNPVTILPDGVDLINDDHSVVLYAQWDWIQLADVLLGQWGNFSKISDLNLPDNIAFTNFPNVFTKVNAFSGTQFIGKVITDDYTVADQDNIIGIDTTGGPIQITLPPTRSASFPRYGPWLYFKIVKGGFNMVSVVADPDTDDLIDGSISVNFDQLYSDLMLFDVAPGFWSDVGASGGGAATASWGGITGTLSDQTDLQAALNTKLTVPASPPPRPANQQEIVALLTSYNLCA